MFLRKFLSFSIFILITVSSAQAETKRILFLTVELGLGQVTVEKALTEELRKQYGKGVIIKRLGSEVLFSAKGRTLLIKRLKKSLKNPNKKGGSLKDRYYLLKDEIFPRGGDYRSKWSELATDIYSDEALAEIRSFKPDAIITSYPFNSIMMQNLQERDLIPRDIKLVTVVADLSPAPEYNLEGLVLLNNEEQRAFLFKLGAIEPDPEKVISLDGLIVRKEFHRPFKKNRLRNKLGFDRHIPLVFVSGGGDGYGLQKIIDFIPEWNPSEPLNVVIVSGRSAETKRQVDQAVEKNKSSKLMIRSLGYVENIYEFMAAADVIVSKPGGSTIAESAALGHGIISLEMLYGGEMRNFNYLKKRGALTQIEPGKLNHVQNLLRLARRVDQGMQKSFPAAATYSTAQRAAEHIMDYLNDRPIAVAPPKLGFVDSCIKWIVNLVR